MQTMSVLVVAAPTAFVIGLSLGITAWKYPGFEKAIKPILAVLQTLPFFTYLLPAVIFFKVGPTAGAVATVVYAAPPMVLMTILGLQKVSPEVIEAGKMSGCTRFQMLRHVYIPSARTEILVGVNQVIMLCLAIVVLTAFIGMSGLGTKLLEMMGSFRLGRSFEIGITIVLLAVTLDGMSKAWVAKQPEHFEKGTPWWKQHRLALLAVGLSMGREIDGIMRTFLTLDWVRAITGGLRVFVNTMVFIPFRNFLLPLPTPALILMVMAFGFALAGRKQALLACDTAQTFPSFDYLLPAIMLFGITDIAVIFSILIFSTVPLVRYTIEGQRWPDRRACELGGERLCLPRSPRAHPSG